MANTISDEQIQEAANYIRNRITTNNPEAKMPTLAVVCGSGLSKLGDEIPDGLVIPYNEIPNFPTTTVCGHKNQMVVGTLAKTPVVILQGRFHHYEGLSFQQCTMYVRVLDALGVEFLIISNAAGGVNPEYKPGDIMMIKDHINPNPHVNVEYNTKGFRFKNKEPLYDKKLISRSQDILKEIGYEGNVHVGMYACLPGPNYETVAEIKRLHNLGIDAVGMSTAPEALVANECGIRTLAFSLISNSCIHDYDAAEEPNHAEVVEVCAHRSDSLKTFTEKLVEFIRCCCICP